MCLRFVFLLIMRLAAWPRLSRREETWKTAEILILRHQLTVLHLSWAILVRKSLVAVDGVEGSAEIVGEGVGGGDGLPSGLDLYGAVAAGCLDEFPD